MSRFVSRNVALKVCSPMLLLWVVVAMSVVCVDGILLDDAIVCESENGECTAVVPEGAFLSRNVARQVLSVEQSEGVGARVRRTIGTSKLRSFDPFLGLDEFAAGRPAGFPDHPHRGFETVTYMLEGEFEHEDFCGHRGKIGPGDLQWMTAGRGILHSEMPSAEGISRGMQLWVNLAKKDKMCEPQYQELRAKDIPHGDKDGVHAVVIAGQALGITSPIYNRTPVHYIHFTMEAGSRLEHPIPVGFNAFIYTLSGTARIAGQDVEAHSIATLTPEGDGILVEAATKCSFVCISGQPLREPIVQHGPFVMNTQQEIAQTMDDYHRGKNGFERARGWKSTIGIH